MRLSMIDGDIGYDIHLCKKAKAFIDGKEVKYCIMADEELGQCIVHKTDNNGKILLNETMDDTLKEVVKGNVKIVIN